MTRFTRLTILSAMTLGLVACGGGAKLGGGKDGAAQAAFQASQPASRNSNTAQSLVEKALASGATTVTISADCAKSGKASLALDASGDTGTGTLHYTITYDACNEDGKNEYNGTMATSMTVTTSSTSVSLAIGMKGKLTIEGEISDYIDADVTLTMDATATSAHSGTVNLVTNGTIKTSDSSYTYSHETVTFTAGELPKA